MKRQLNKTLLATMLAALSGLPVAGHAAFTEDTGYAGFNGTVNFGGTVTDLTPKWMWEVPNAGTPYDGYDINLNLGTTASGKTTFAYTAMPDLTLLNGYLKSEAVNGGQGLQPVITLGLPGQEFKITTGTVSTASLTATVKATGTMADGTTTVDGILQFNLAQGGVIAGTEGSTAKIQPAGFLVGVDGGAAPANGAAVASSSDAKYVKALEAAALLLGNATDYAASTYGTKTLDRTKVWPAATMSNFDRKKLFASYSAVVSDVKTVWSATDIPASWTADIGLTVAHQ